MKRRLLIKNGIVVTLNENEDIFKSDILVEDGYIKKIGEYKGNADNLKVIDADGMVVMPSFYNMHVHLGETIFRGRCDGMDLWQYLDVSHDSYKNPRWMEEEERIHRLSGLITIMECIKNGAAYIACNRGWSEAAEMGINTDCLYPVVNISKLKTYYENIKSIPEIKKEYDNDKIQTSIFLQSMYLCDVEKLEQIKGLMDSDSTLKLFVHIAETTKEAEYVKEKFNMSPIQALNKFGLLNSRTYCVHSIYLTGEDIYIIKETGANVILCPVSNLKLGDGYPRVQELMENNIPLIVATDGFATNNSANLLEELKIMAIISKGKIPCSSLLQMITKNPASSVYKSSKGGVLEEGAYGDISIFSTEAYNLCDYKIIPNHIIYNHSEFKCQHVLCRGEILFENGSITKASVGKIQYEYCELLKSLYKK